MKEKWNEKLQKYLRYIHEKIGKKTMSSCAHIQPASPNAAGKLFSLNKVLRSSAKFLPLFNKHQTSTERMKVSEWNENFLLLWIITRLLFSYLFPSLSCRKAKKKKLNLMGFSCQMSKKNYFHFFSRNVQQLRVYGKTFGRQFSFAV